MMSNIGTDARLNSLSKQASRSSKALSDKVLMPGGLSSGWPELKFRLPGYLSSGAMPLKFRLRGA